MSTTFKNSPRDGNFDSLMKLDRKECIAGHNYKISTNHNFNIINITLKYGIATVVDIISDLYFSILGIGKPIILSDVFINYAFRLKKRMKKEHKCNAPQKTKAK